MLKILEDDGRCKFVQIVLVVVFVVVSMPQRAFVCSHFMTIYPSGALLHDQLARGIDLRDDLPLDHAVCGGLPKRAAPALRSTLQTLRLV